MSLISFDLREIPHAKNQKSTGYYPVVANPRKLTPQQLYEKIESRCTLTQTDVKAVLNALAGIMAESLSAGVRVELPEIGSFSPALRSDAPITHNDEKQTARHLRVGDINFRPKKELVDRLQDVQFHRTRQPLRTGSALSDEELLMRLRDYFSTSREPLLSRRDFQALTGYSRTFANQVLPDLVDRGILRKIGQRNSPYYLLVENSVES